MKKGKQIRWWVITGVVVGIFLTICCTTWPTELLQLPLTLHEQSRLADIVIVLGAGARKHGDPLPPQGKERVEQGLGLIKQGLAPTMIVSGGFSKHAHYVEADLMKSFAIAQGFPADNVIEENKSVNTWENAVNSFAIMQKNNWQTALVVTSSYHTYRACAIFHKLKVSVTCIAAPLTIIPTNTVYERLTDFRSVVREYGAIIYNFFQGHL